MRVTSLPPIQRSCACGNPMGARGGSECGACSRRRSRAAAAAAAVSTNTATTFDKAGAHESDFFASPAVAERRGAAALAQLAPLLLTRAAAALPAHQEHVHAHLTLSAAIEHARDDAESLHAAIDAALSALRSATPRLPRARHDDLSALQVRRHTLTITRLLAALFEAAALPEAARVAIVEGVARVFAPPADSSTDSDSSSSSDDEQPAELLAAPPALSRGRRRWEPTAAQRSFFLRQLKDGVKPRAIVASFNAAVGVGRSVALPTFRTWLARQEDIRRIVRPTRKSGNNDPSSLWARASLAQAQQFKRQLEANEVRRR